jgi:hypothetical protein
MNEDEADLPNPPIVPFSSIENQFQMNLITEDAIIAHHETVRCFDCGA